MRIRLFCLLILLATLTSCIRFSEAATEDVFARHFRGAGPHEVEVVNQDWSDAKRDRIVPVRMYFPKTGTGPFPLIIFSHGLGATRGDYEFVGRHWASHGYISVHVEHEGTDRDAFLGSRHPVLTFFRAVSPTVAVQRMRDISYAIDRMGEMAREEGPLRGRVELERVGVAGHSYGALTTLVIAGQALIGPDGTTYTLADPRVKAGIPMSAPVINSREEFEAAYGRITLPLLHLTGTQDAIPIGRTDPEARRIPYDHIRGADQYLVTYRGGDHISFVGWVRPGPVGRLDRVLHPNIRMVTTAFWEAYLRDRAEVREWLAGKGYEAALNGAGKLEKRLEKSAR